MTDLSDVIERLRLAQRQYRHNNDNSPDLFSPREGFVMAYDKAAVDSAIRDLEALRDEHAVPVSRLREVADAHFQSDDRRMPDGHGAIAAILYSLIHEAESAALTERIAGWPRGWSVYRSGDTILVDGGPGIGAMLKPENEQARLDTLYQFLDAWLANAQFASWPEDQAEPHIGVPGPAYDPDWKD